jgi:hypothetical protein
MENEKELAYWSVFTVVEALALHYLGRGLLKPADLVDAANRAIEKAHKELLEDEERANSGH